MLGGFEANWDEHRQRREREREKLIKDCIQSLHGYCSIFVYLQRFRRVNPHFCTIKVGQFLVIESSMQEIDV